VNATPRVLLIDGSADTEAVVRAVLEPRGMSVSRTRSHGDWTRPETTPDVVVVDLDDVAETSETVFEEAGQILIGSTRVEVSNPRVRFLEKPFHFPELIQVLEDLLTTNRVA
jgi:DNA-binding NtrC family response regulator